MKQWLCIFTAVLLAGLLMFTWHRRVVLWEAEAARQAEFIDGAIARAERWAESDSDAVVQMIRAQSTLLESAAATGARHLGAFAPLRDEAALRSAIGRAREAVREISAVLAEHTAEKAELRKVEAEQLKIEAASWAGVAQRHAEGLMEIVAAIPFLQGPSLANKMRELDAAVMVADQHLARAPAGADTERLRLALKAATTPR